MKGLAKFDNLLILQGAPGRIDSSFAFAHSSPLRGALRASKILRRAARSSLRILSNLYRFKSFRETEFFFGIGVFRFGILFFCFWGGAPGRIRTSDLLVRSQTLYPTELRAHSFFDGGERGIRTLDGVSPILP